MRRFLFAIAGLLATAVVSALAVLPPPVVNGPSLGDQNTNLFTLWQAVTQDTVVQFTPAVSAGQTTTQAGCTQLALGISNVTTSAATGSVCLPTAIGGRQAQVNNATTQTIDIFGSAASFTSGTQDTINGTTGTTAYTGLTNGKNTQCFSPANGVWACTSGN